jgi:hypothetical protein
MTDYSADETYPPGLKAQAAYYGLYVVLLVLAFVVGPVIWRQTLYFIFYVFTDPNVWWTRSLYAFSVVGGVIALVVGVFLAEPYLRAGMRRGELVRRFLRVAVPLIVLGGIGYAIQLLGMTIQ